MTTDIEVHQGNTLALSSDQPYWNNQQLATLRHMGVEGANEGDLMVFHHVCQKTGLDPFARQIHMIGRNAKNPRTDQWETKYTIQTGIDGFRLIGRRAADQRGVTISIESPQWAHPEGGWRDVWTPAWGFPVAARVTIKRGGEPFTAVALFDEYKQTKRGGEVTSMWAQRPAGQLAKCAEALAWRMAFPQDLSGIYAEEEMAQADNVQPATEERRGGGLGAALAKDASPESPYLNPQSKLGREMFALFNEAGITEKADRLDYVYTVIDRRVESSKEMTDDDAVQVIAALRRVLASETDAVDAEVVDDQPVGSDGTPDPTADPSWGQGGGQ